MVKNADDLATSITIIDVLMRIKQSVIGITTGFVTKYFNKSCFIMINLCEMLDYIDFENEIIVAEQSVNKLPTHMQGEDLFSID